MRISIFLIILMLAGTSMGQNIVSPVFVHKDGDASATAKSGSDKDLYIDGGARQNVGWITFQMQGIDVSKVAQAQLVLYIRSVGCSGTLQVRRLIKDISAPENNVLGASGFSRESSHSISSPPSIFDNGLVSHRGPWVWAVRTCRRSCMR